MKAKMKISGETKRVSSEEEENNAVKQSKTHRLIIHAKPRVVCAAHKAVIMARVAGEAFVDENSIQRVGLLGLVK